jgi:aspartate carbamoyltransferase catalytic subunit
MHRDVDVLYVTRVQKERFTDLAEYDQVKDATSSIPVDERAKSA